MVREIGKGNFRALLLLYMAKQLQAPPYEGIVPSVFFESVSGWIEREGVTPNYTINFRTNMAFYYEAVKLWERAGALERNGKRGGYVVTPLGEDFLNRAGDDWRVWPITFTVAQSDGQLDFLEPIYAEKETAR